jgi:hypothetical protein
MLHLNVGRCGLIAGLVVALTGCGQGRTLLRKSKDSDDESPRGISFSESRENFARSQYCPKEKPALPVDPTPAYTFKRDLINQKLSSEKGLQGWLHGAVHAYKQYVFTYRNEDEADERAFFHFEEMNLVGANSAVWQQLKSLNRHDKVALKGRLLDNGSPIKHIIVEGLTVLKSYANPVENTYVINPDTYQFPERFEAFGQVHALAHSEELGYAVVLERQNFIMPIGISSKHEAFAKQLYKGDIINVAVRTVTKPGQPPHFVSDADRDNGLEIVDPLVNCHGQKREVVGHLVKFNKSPAINTDVYAVRVVDGNGIARNMTFFPSTDVESDTDGFVKLFKDISAKAANAWNAKAEISATAVRNFYEKKAIKVKAKGMLNVVSTEQANAQVYLDTADNLEFTFEE